MATVPVVLKVNTIPEEGLRLIILGIIGHQIFENNSGIIG